MRRKFSSFRSCSASGFANNSRQFGSRLTASALMLAMAFSAGAAPIDLADAPVGGMQIVPPNFWITFDRSGSMGDLQTYDPTQRYWPWLYDGTIMPPKGPVRFPDANVSSVCRDGYPYASGYAIGTPDRISYLCTSATTNISAVTPPGTPPAGYTAAPLRTDCTASSCAGVEKQNYANFLQYYRTRLKLSRAGIGEAVGALPYSARMGFVEYEGTTITFNQVASLNGLDGGGALGTSSPRYTFFANRLYPNRAPGGGTPTRPALITLGEQLRNDAPYRDDPANAASPIRSCRRNVNFLMTDGFWNNLCHVNFPTIGNADTNIPAPAPVNYDGSPMLQGQSFNGSPFGDIHGNTLPNSGSCNTNNGPTLADIAWYYWAQDLRPLLTNNVDSSFGDPVNHQHLVNYAAYVDQDPLSTLAPTAQTYLDNTNSALNALANWSGSTAPTAPSAITWPNPLDTENYERVYDLWHAGLNSRGGAIHAKTARELQLAAADAFADRTNVEAEATVAVSSQALAGVTDPIAFSASFDARRWAGEIKAYRVDPETAELIDAPPYPWANSAGWQLDDLYHDTGVAHDGRRVVTFAGGPATVSMGILFRGTATRKDGTTLASVFGLNTGYSDGAEVINYLRGKSDNEGTAFGKYRPRPTVNLPVGDPAIKPGLLGDIIGSSPLYIGKPNWEYLDTVDPGYSAFKASKATRTKMLAVGANDGMLHVFNAETGAEIWAYVPSFVFDCSLANTACVAPAWAPNANLMRDRARYLGFEHKFLVNGPLTSQDVDFNKTAGASGSPNWHTMLVGALGKGGRGIFALDITDPPADETEAKDKVMWEFPYHSAFSGGSKVAIPEAKNVGYTYAWTHVVKVNIGGEGKWVVLLPSGYNNGNDTGGDGKGRLFVLNARTGEIIREIVTSAGTPETPSGLAQISAWVNDQNINKFSDTVYGGDQLGNLWRFDLSDPDPANWGVSLIAKLKDPSGVAQPVTTAPELTMISGKRWVLVGTGKFLGKTDRPGAQGATTDQAYQSTQIQSMWGFVDPGASTTLADPVRDVVAHYAISAPGAAGSVRTATLASAGSGAGWVLDLTASERINMDPFIGLNFLAAAVNSAPTDPCEKNGLASFLVLNLDSLASSSASISAGYTLGYMTLGGVTLAQTKDEGIRLIGTVSKKVEPCPTDLTCGEHWVIKTVLSGDVAGRVAKRAFWRELPAQ